MVEDRHTILLGQIMTRAEQLERIAEASAKLVDVIYEFDELDPDCLEACMAPHLDYLDTLLVEAGYRPPYEPPTPEEIAAWVKARVKDAYRDED